MIKLINVNKYFNRHRKSEIHVIDNTSLELPDNGLVTFLGESGCGKTTLLNAIGGLDKVNKGKIIIDGEKITGRSINKVDKIRSLKIGYIFQDYNLIDNMTVFDNVALALKMNGLKDKTEIEKRVNYVLERVGMYRYRKRLANMLSGGERQRVGIARAIVKNPKIIIADEPTGNLDSKNTLEIMNIIKSISRERLVILVTHEKDIAEFYSDRILHIQDGKVISDEKNDVPSDLDYRLDGKIYLKDIKNKETVNKDNLKINYYNDNNEKIELDIVLKNGNIYINSKTNEKVEVLNNESTVEFVNEHYKKIDKSIYENYKFDLDSVSDKNYKVRYSSIYNPITSLVTGIKKVLNYKAVKKVLLFGFVLSAMFITFSVSSILASLKVDEKNFLTYNKNYLLVNDKQVSLDDFVKYSDNEDIKYVIPGESIVTFILRFNKYYQTFNSSVSLTGSMTDKSYLSENDIIYGRSISESNEIIVDKFIIDKVINEDYNPKMAGYGKAIDYINQVVSLGGVKDYTIVGISDTGEPNIYVSDSEFYTIIDNSKEDLYSYDDGSTIVDYNLVSDFTLVKGRMPENAYEVIINNDLSDTYKLNKTIDTKINDTKLTVVGYYTSLSNVNKYLVGPETIRIKVITSTSNVSVYTENKEAVTKYFKDNDINVEDSYKKSKDVYMSDIRDSLNSKLLFSGIILVVSLVEIFLMIRSSFLSRVREVGILRAIGFKRRDIYKMFGGEILAITLLASTPGYLIMSYILYQLAKMPYVSSYIEFSPIMLIVSYVLILMFNLVFGLIPVYRTISKRPARILSRNDA